MRKLITGVFLLHLCSFAALAPQASAALIDNCAEIGSFKLGPYIDLASHLQTLPKNEVVRRLKLLAFDGRYNEQIIVLCRMLFEPMQGKKFDRPQLGGPQLYGGSTMKDWPLEPFTIVDDIPFAIVIGYTLGGSRQGAGAYLDYCLANAQWTTRRYHAVTKSQVDVALQQLLKSKAWKRPLDAWELGLLKKQAE